ncbi:hypothetical protein [Pedobacter cryophilus]|uniref:Uncharacterized protein n=1 Tax=Pedobacter cryophilus TaxID=2571271 RepID=A0A4U1BUP8_9SPHI|nr:hypothetical protein [Pedobacter cryophilus]TKB96378.1 hypothetical protein FA046_14460 [Pedobacter cryophilus]
MKRIVYAFMLFAAILACKKDKNQVIESKRDIQRSYTFSNGIMPENVLRSYLSRSITQAEFLTTDGFYNDGAYPDKADDTRMLKNMGAKFIGRSIYTWGLEGRINNPLFMSNAKVKISEMHLTDSDMLFQAAIFEIITPDVNTVPVPAWVFQEFGLAVSARNFVYTDMINLDGVGVGQWGYGSVPDISRLETRMYFFFLATKYIGTGIEAIHFGQVELMSMVDKNNNYAGWSDLLTRIRAMAKTKAIRGTVICDAHLGSGGIVIDGKLLFDFVSFPMRIKEISGEPQKGELKKFYLDAIYGRTKGGITPSGWSCDKALYQVEFDNFGISDHPGVSSISDEWTWGYDEISWYYNQSEDYRNEFLKYASKWIVKTDLNGYVQMPGSRVVITSNGATRYRANKKSDACVNGRNQEETIKLLWLEEE